MDKKHFNARLALAGAAITAMIVVLTFQPKKLEAETHAVGQKYAVKLYETAWCGYCKATRELLKKYNVPYQARDIEKSNQAKQEFKQLGGRGVPVLVVGDEILYGYNQRKIVNTLEAWVKQNKAKDSSKTTTTLQPWQDDRR